MSSQIARRSLRRAAAGKRVRSALGHPFGMGLWLGVAFFVALWALGALSDRGPWGRSSSAGAPTAPPGTYETIPRDEPGVLRPALSPAVEDVALLRLRRLQFPVPQANPKILRDDFGDPRTGHAHEALDILAPRGTPIVAVDDGVVQKLFTSVRGGLTIYHFDPEGAYSYYYAHLDRYADGLREGQPLRKGDVVGYVGTSGNAPPQTPHLHFAIFKLGPEKEWWKGAAINPFPVWREPVKAD
jgi:murein DD-endopeptidase MepM/ murein hydrolase activator NlpD